MFLDRIKGRGVIASSLGVPYKLFLVVSRDQRPGVWLYFPQSYLSAEFWLSLGLCYVFVYMCVRLLNRESAF